MAKHIAPVFRTLSYRFTSVRLRAAFERGIAENVKVARPSLSNEENAKMRNQHVFKLPEVLKNEPYITSTELH